MTDLHEVVTLSGNSGDIVVNTSASSVVSLNSPAVVLIGSAADVTLKSLVARSVSCPKTARI